MQLNLGTYLETVLDAENSDLFAVYEVYASDYDSASGFDPRDAERTFAEFTYVLPFGPVTYKRQVLEGVIIEKTVKKEINSVSINFSNVDNDVDGFRYMARYVNSNVIEGKKLVVRVLDFSVAATIGNDGAILANSIILFAGRCDKPDGFNREHGTLTANQDCGTIEALIPRYQFQQHCPIKFKGPECLGTELLSEKSAEYQAGTVCNKTFEKCTFYSNTEFFQGIRIVQIESSFLYKSHESLFKKILNILPGISRKKVTVNDSTHDGTPYGNAIPTILGRWYKQLIALEFKDIGTSINFKMAACRGKIHDFINVRNESPAFTQPLGVTKHLGEYGGDGSQTADTVFPEHSFHSRLAYITGYCNGSDIETEDAAPQISSVVAGIVPDQMYFDVDPDGTGKLSTGTGGVTAPGTSFSAPGQKYNSYDEAVTPTNPEAYWKLDGTSIPPSYPNTLCVDSADSHDGSLIPLSLGSNLVVGIPGFLETESPGNGMSGAIGQIPSSGNTSGSLRPSSTKFAFSCRAKHTASGCEMMISHGFDVPNTYIAFGSRSSGLFADNVVFALELEGALSFAVISKTVPVNTVVSVACVRDGAFMGIWINGCLSASRSDLPADVACDPQDAPWRLGFIPNIVFGPVFASSGMARVALYPNASLTEAQIQSIHASAVTVPIGCPGEDWTDNPVDHVRYLLTEPSALNIPENMVDDYESAFSAAYNCRIIKDETNAERALLPNTEVSRAGVDFQRYTSTGLLGPQSFEATRTQIPAGVPARALINVGLGGNRIGEYEFYDPAAPPTSADLLIAYRKGATCNTELTQAKKVIDVINDQIFPTFGGFFRWNAKGQIIIDGERPADWTKLRVASEVGATELVVNDVLPWKTTKGSPYLLHGKLHIAIKPNWIYRDQTARLGATGFTADDVGKYARQVKGNSSLWQLTATTPTWIEVQDNSEVRPVNEAVYSDLGDEITLAASASGGPTAVASDATLTGGSETVQSSATVTITGSLADGSSITVTIDSIDCVLDLVNGETSSIIGHRMACVINADPILREYIEAHAANNVVTIYSKIGVLRLASELEEEHEAGIELTRVLRSFAGRALSYADTTRANILDGTFEWPEASRQPVINQIKATHKEAIQDFGDFPIVVNDDQHQEDYVKVNPYEPDHSAIDNYDQDARRCNALLNKFRAGDRFYKFGATGRALALDQGDVICASDDSGNYRNVLMRIEDISIRNPVEVFFVNRLYSRDQFSDLVPDPTDVPLESGLPNFQQPPPNIAFDTVTFPPDGLTQSTDGSAGITSVRGGLIFGDSVYAQYAKVRLILRGGVVVDESINSRLPPNSDGKGVFEFLASVDGLYTVSAAACNQWGCSTAITASIIVGFGVDDVRVTEASEFRLTEDGSYRVVET
jgi:hypothetical protein